MSRGRRSRTRRRRCVDYTRRNRPSLGNHLHRRTRNGGGWSRTRHLLLLLNGQGTSRSARQLTLLLLEQRPRRRSGGSGNYGPAHHRGIGTGRIGDSRAWTAEDARDLWADSGGRAHGAHGSHLVRLHPHSDLLHGARAGERVLRNCDHGSGNRTVGVIGHWHAAVLDVIVIHVGHVGVIDNGGVRDIHAGDVTAACVVRRDVDIAWSKREPTNRRRTSAETNRKPTTASPAKAHPSHECGRINRP